MQDLVTSRLKLRRFEISDADLIFELLNDPAWIKNIGDRQIHKLSDAEAYIGRLHEGYREHGFGFFCVEEKVTGTKLGMCGLVKRKELTEIDLGFAFLPAGRGKGYAVESSQAVVQHAREIGIKVLLGVALPENLPSIRVLEKVGMVFRENKKLYSDEPLLAIYHMSLK